MTETTGTTETSDLEAAASEAQSEAVPSQTAPTREAPTEETPSEDTSPEPDPAVSALPAATAATPSGPPPSITAILRARWAGADNRVAMTAAVMALIQFALLGQLLSRQFFFQDDFDLERNAAVQHLGWSYLMTPHNQHLMPGGLLIAWIVTRLSPMNWALAAASILAFQALASFAVYRVLRLLFGTRPAILALFGFYLFCTANMPTSGWWAAALEVLPFEAMAALALGSHLRYLREGQTRHAVEAMAFTFLALVFMAKAVVVPFLLFGVTVCYFTDRPTIRAGMLDALRRQWRIWPVYAAMLVCYETFYRARLDQVGATAKVPDSLNEIWMYCQWLVGHDLIPVLVGGPWKWAHNPDSYEFTIVPDGLVYLSWLAFAAVVAASIVFRNRAGRAWLILAGYVVGADIVPVVVGRLSQVPAGQGWAHLFGADTRYIADAAIVAAICFGLAFLPVAGETEPYRRALPNSPRFAGLAQSVGGAVAVLVAVGLVTSTVSYHQYVNGDANRLWISNARAALAAGTSGSSILDQTVPLKLNVAIDHDSALESFVLGSVASPAQTEAIKHAAPVDTALTFDDQGLLRPIVGLADGVSAPPGPQAFGYCFGGAQNPTVVIKVPQELGFKHWIVRFGYIDHDATAVHLKFALGQVDLRLPAGAHNVTLNLDGNGSVIEFSGVTSQAGLCIASMSIGLIPKLG